MKNITGQQISNALKLAPKVIQEEIADGERTASMISGLGTKLKLHIDKIGLVAGLSRNMLLGLISPDEFFKDLIEAKIPEKDAREIMSEINQQIFVPLREEMRKGTSAVPRPSPEATVGTAQAPRPSWGSQTSPNTARPTVPPPRPTAQIPPNEPLRSVLNAVAAKPVQPQPRTGSQTSPTSPKAMQGTAQSREGSLTSASPKLLEDHEEPHIEFKKAPPPANLPGIIQPPKPIIKEYSSDPYREPIDEEGSRL